tara:strand:- start:82 stop:702 length:621 start_codon:yes stop_codon:yes gene_type:complete
MTQFGHELRSYNYRLQNKITEVHTTLTRIEHELKQSGLDTSHVRKLSKSLQTNIDSHRSESSLSNNETGFMKISSRDLHHRINLSDSNVSPVIKLWEKSLHKTQGKIQSALRFFFSSIEKYPGEISGPTSEISNEIKMFDLKKSCKVAQLLGQYDTTLSEMDTDNMKIFESAIGLTSYILGDETEYISPQVQNIIQEKHLTYLKNM